LTALTGSVDSLALNKRSFTGIVKGKKETVRKLLGRTMLAAFAAAIALATGTLCAATGPTAAAPAPSDPSVDGSLLVRAQVLTATLSNGTALPFTVVLPVAPSFARPVVLVVHGYATTGWDYAWIAEHLASRGFAAILVETTNPYEASFEVWATQTIATLDALVNADGNPWSGVFGELDLTRVAVLGHSYGATTAISVAARDKRIKAVVALEPGAVSPYFQALLARAAQVNVPLLVVGGALDTICPPATMGIPVFQAATLTPQKLFVEIAHADHLGFLDYYPEVAPNISSQAEHTIASRYFTAWLETKAEGLSDPDGYTTGVAAARDKASGDLSSWLP
jgi:predicted dienelactone hydrolase